MQVLLNTCKDIGLAVNTGKTKYMEIGSHRGMIANEHIKIGSNYRDRFVTQYITYLNIRKALSGTSL